MKEWTKYGIVAADELTGLSLVRDERDPPRFYLQFGRRSDMVSIGDASDALATYSRQVERLQALRLRAHLGVADRAAEATGLIQQSPPAAVEDSAQLH
jgi:hypothetical protein